MTKEFKRNLLIALPIGSELTLLHSKTLCTKVEDTANGYMRVKSKKGIMLVAYNSITHNSIEVAGKLLPEDNIMLLGGDIFDSTFELQIPIYRQSKY